MACLAMACHGMAWHALACHAMPCIGAPWPAMACIVHALACHGTPLHALACRGMPWHAMPCIGTPWHAMARMIPRARKCSWLARTISCSRQVDHPALSSSVEGVSVGPCVSCLFRTMVPVSKAMAAAAKAATATASRAATATASSRTIPVTMVTYLAIIDACVCPVARLSGTCFEPH